MTKVDQILQALAQRPLTNAELCELVDDISPYVARTMAALCTRGLVVNRAEPGRGHRAVYALAEAYQRGRAA